MTAILEVADLRHTFGGVAALDGASLRVRGATITGLIGPNGAGKSTLLNAVAGQLRPDAGRILFAGTGIGGRAPHTNARAGIIRTFQRPRLFAHLTLLENLLVGAQPGPGERIRAALSPRRPWRRTEAAQVDRARDLLARFGLLDEQFRAAGTLSGGQQRIADLLRATMAGPRLLLLDEPMAGVSPGTAAHVAELLTGLRDGGTTMLVVEHDLGFVERLCHPVVVMAQGRVLAEGPLAELRRNREVQDAYLAG